jgi:hypothetical protein
VRLIRRIPFPTSWCFMTHHEVRFETGTVRSGEISTQNVLGGIQIRIVPIATTETQKHLSRSISPLGMTTRMTSLTRVLRTDRPENNTVVFTSTFKPPQPVPITPCSERSSHTMPKTMAFLCSVIQVTQSFSNYQSQLRCRSDLLSHLIHALFECPPSPSLSSRTVLTPLDPPKPQTGQG